MDIIKHVKDLNLSEQMSEFVNFLTESVDSYVVIEKIKNKKHILQNAIPKNDLPLTNYYEPGAQASRIVEN